MGIALEVMKFKIAEAGEVDARKIIEVAKEFEGYVSKEGSNNAYKRV